MSRGALAGCRAGIDRLLGGLQRHAFGLQRPHDVLKVAYGPREAIHAGNDQRVSLTHALSRHAKDDWRPVPRCDVSTDVRFDRHGGRGREFQSSERL